MSILSTSAIQAAADRLQGWVRQTPILRLAPGEIADGEVVLKLEQLQLTGSFKVRGAFNTLLQSEKPAAGVIAASGGNHGIAVAYAARALGMNAEIFVPQIASPIKIAKLRGIGAKVFQTGHAYADSLAAMRERQAETGALEIHAYDQPTVLAGQGTVAMEFERVAGDLDRMAIAVGGGGLIGGAMAWLETRVAVTAVEPEGCACLHQALQVGQSIDVEVTGVAADSLGARRIGALCLALAQKTAPQSLTVSDREIIAAQGWLWDRCRLIAEPGGATALAAVLAGKIDCPEGQRLGVVVCGSNVDLASLM